MKVIPVIDLMGGSVVRARGGERSNYRPITTPLSQTADPLDVVRGLIRLFPFSIIYIADLDAICGRNGNNDSLTLLRKAFPNICFWIDNGAADAPSIKFTRQFGQPVIGSESQHDLSLVMSEHDAVLSLDFRGEGFMGPPEIWTRPETWPARVIAMTLARVGADAGPDMQRLESVIVRAGDRSVYAAGGLRDAGDLAILKNAGAAGVLVSSALHEGRLSFSDLELAEKLAERSAVGIKTLPTGAVSS